MTDSRSCTVRTQRPLTAWSLLLSLSICLLLAIATGPGPALAAPGSSEAGSAPAALDAAGLFDRRQDASPSAAPPSAGAPSSPVNASTSSYNGPLIKDAPGLWSSGLSLALPLLANMTLAEKAALVTGVDGPCVGTAGGLARLGLPRMCLQDGPLGVRPVRRASQFPAGVTVAATWDRRLMRRRAEALGREFRAKGVHMWLGPVSGSGPLGRSPLGGRNAEGFGSDEYLGGAAAYESVVGAQSQGVIACPKHFLIYEQETSRRPYGSIETLEPITPSGPNADSAKEIALPVSSFATDLTTHEIYLWGFAEAVRAGAGAVMCSYNRINASDGGSGSHACSDSATLNGLLKGELNFRAAVVSDWGGLWSNAESALAGTDVSMPGLVGGNGRFYGPALEEAVRNGTLPEVRLDDMVLRTLAPWLTLQNVLVDGTNSSAAPSSGPAGADKWPAEPTFDIRDMSKPTNNVRADHWKLIRQIGEESATLLKNDRSRGGGLPLKGIHELPSLLIAGTDAGPTPRGQSSCGATGCPPGTPGILTSIGGSGWAIPPYVIDPQAAIQHYVKEGGVDVNLALDNSDLVNAGNQANVSTSSLVFVSAFAGEGADRPNLGLDNNGEALIKAVADKCNDTIVILHAPGAVLMEEWIDHPNVTAVLFAYYPGQEGAESLPPLLFGEKSPSGKLPFVIAKKLEDYPPGGIQSDQIAQPIANFTEGRLVDWKWLQAKNVTPRFDFGHGLSYSTFSWASLVYIDGYAPDSTSLHPTNEQFDGKRQYDSLYDVIGHAYVDMTNTGEMNASEVAQLYIRFPRDNSTVAVADQPVRVLRGFDKLALAPRQTGRAAFELRRKDVSTYDVVNARWRIPAGEFIFEVGSSSTAIHSTTTVTFVGQ